MTLKNAIYNPHNKPEAELPFIYGFNNGNAFGSDWLGCLISADGVGLGSHICSSEGWMYYDLGIYEGHRPDRHEDFKKHYPDGYRMKFVSYDEVMKDTGLVEAFRLNKELQSPSQGSEAEIKVETTT